MLEVVFLGTGSATPTRFRNLSATALVRLGEIFLFDCGEGTQMQFRRAGLRPGRLTRIFISHFHGDHLFGLPGLLTSLQMADIRQPLHLYGPVGLQDFIDFHRRLSQFALRYPLHIHEVPDACDEMVWQEEAYRIVCRPLVHRMRCLGWAVIENPRPGRFDARQAAALGVPNGPLRSALQMGRKIVLENGKVILPEQVVGPPRRGHHFAYCLDTVPTAATLALARDADLLIHDATFPGEDAAWANETGHSTVVQAAEIARQANVRQLVLTHLSGRLTPKDDDGLLQQARAVFPNTVLAQDLLRLHVEWSKDHR